MHADVAQRSGAQKSIGDGMRQNVGIGVTVQSELGRNRDTAEDERPAGRDAVDVPALTDADETQDDALAASSSPRNSRARSISDGLVILILRSLPETTLTST